MSAITVGNDLVHYEVLGRGRPVILLHGWLGSWRYWVPTMQQLSAKYRVYAIDLFGFGDSGKDSRHYDAVSQARMLREFMEKLGIGKAAIIGHSFGAVVGTLFAVEYREFAARMMLISMPLWDQGGLPDLNANDSLNRYPSTVTQITDGSRRNVESYTLEERASAAEVTRLKMDRATLLENNQLYQTDMEKALNAVRAAENGTVSPDPKQDSKPEPKVDQKIELKAEDLEKLARIREANPTAAAATPPGITINLPSNIARKTTAPTGPLPPDRPSGIRAAGDSPLGALRVGDPVALLMRYVDRSSPDLDKLRAEVSKTAPDAIEKTSGSLLNINIAVTLHRLTTPTLLLHGEDDPLTPPPTDEVIKRVNSGKKLGTFLPFLESGVRHFPMLEISARFNRLAMDFLEAPDLTNVQFRDTWTRTIR